MGALILRVGFGVYYTDNLGNYLGPEHRGLGTSNRGFGRAYYRTIRNRNHYQKQEPQRIVLPCITTYSANPLILTGVLERVL